MGQNTTISWANHTFSPWWGCDKVSPACANCYAETWAKRLGMPRLWDGERRFFGDKHWHEPLRWDRKAAQSGVRPRVFCASMADVFDNHPAVEPHRQRLWTLIRHTPHLDWLLLTKRVSNIAKMLPVDWSHSHEGYYPNVWLGISVVTQAEVDRDVPRLLKVPAALHFLSCEPLIERVELSTWLGEEIHGHTPPRGGIRVPRSVDVRTGDRQRGKDLADRSETSRSLERRNTLDPMPTPTSRERNRISQRARDDRPQEDDSFSASVGLASLLRTDTDGHDDQSQERDQDGQQRDPSPGLQRSQEPRSTRISWVIVGGESGPLARPVDVQWMRDIRKQCADAGAAYFLKQLGARPGFRLEDEERRGNMMPSFYEYDEAARLYIKRLDDRKGENPAEWPPELNVRELPR